MNIIQKYEIIRKMSDKDFELLKYMYNEGHLNTFENIAKIVKIGIACLLAYISYTNPSTAITVSTAFSAILMLFNNKLTKLIPSIIVSSKVVNRKDRMDIARRIHRILSDIKLGNMQKLSDKIDELDEELNGFKK